MTGKGLRPFGGLLSTDDIHFKIFNDFDQWLQDLVAKDPNRREWFSVDIQDRFPIFREGIRREAKVMKLHGCIQRSNLYIIV